MDEIVFGSGKLEPMGYRVVDPGRVDDRDLLVVGWAESVVDFLGAELSKGMKEDRLNKKRWASQEEKHR